MPRGKKMHTVDILRVLLFSVDLTGPKLLSYFLSILWLSPACLRCRVISLQGDLSVLCHMSTDCSLSASMCRGEVARLHRLVAFHQGAVILEISNCMEQNALACQAVNSHLLILLVCVRVHFFSSIFF